MRLKNRVAIVTGAASGFGRAIAQMYAHEGATVVVADINPDGGKETVSLITKEEGQAFWIKADVSDAASFSNLVSETVQHFGKLNILVNNAGYTHTRRPMLEVDEETFDKVYSVNVKSIFHSAHAAVPVFRQQGYGCIINIASTAGVRPRPGLTWYNGSKGAAIILTKSMAVELAPDNVRVNAINPVMGETGLLTEFLGGEDSQEARAKVIETIPLGRLSVPADIAKAALFLASDEAEFITGVCMEVDGGRCI